MSGLFNPLALYHTDTPGDVSLHPHNAKQGFDITAFLLATDPNDHKPLKYSLTN
jgi:hypothetical protein